MNETPVEVKPPMIHSRAIQSGAGQEAKTYLVYEVISSKSPPTSKQAARMSAKSSLRSETSMQVRVRERQQDAKKPALAEAEGATCSP